MDKALWVIIGLVLYVVGMIVFRKYTPKLTGYAVDQPQFLGYASVVIIAGIMLFGSVVLTVGALNGNLFIKVVNFFLMAFLFFMGVRLGLYCLRLRTKHSISRILSASYCFFLSGASIYGIIQLFITR